MGKRCLQSRPRGPAPKISPARKGWVHSQALERRRCGTTLFVCSLGAKPRDLQFCGPFLERWNIMLKQNCHLDRSVPGFPATPRWKWPRVRLSVRKAA
jgi:hypothetical protein